MRSFCYQKMTEMPFFVNSHLYFPLILLLPPFVCQKVDRYVTFSLGSFSVHPTVIQALIPASSAFTWPATDYFSAKVTGCVQSANPVFPPKVPAGNLPLRAKRISAVRFAFLSFGPLIGQKNNPVAGRENGYMREIKKFNHPQIRNL